MSFGFAEQKAARRRRWRIVRWLLTTAFLLVLGVSSYWTGAKLAKSEVTRLERKVADLEKDAAALRERNAALESEAAIARESESKWQARYKAEVPTGKSRELLTLIEDEIAKGADPQRVAFLVTTAADERSCDSALQTKRFLLRTPLYSGANDAVSFANNAIIVTGEGALSSDPDGKPQAWFDPAKPVTLSFRQPGGDRSEASGLLPLHHSVVRGDTEYRFTVTASESQGFITVTAERCAFP
ncbi:MAG: hypothetical protein JSU82_11960 [Rhodospirillales bacterium]|nr:MAG: hypothetical protein JSU82_11960 [Rhodospirillales bacterium]